MLLSECVNCEYIIPTSHIIIIECMKTFIGGWGKRFLDRREHFFRKVIFLLKPNKTRERCMAGHQGTGDAFCSGQEVTERLEIPKWTYLGKAGSHTWKEAC